MLPLCAPSQQAYQVGLPSSSALYSSSSGDSQAQACVAFVSSQYVGLTVSVAEITDHICKTTYNSNVFPIIKVCEDTPFPELTPSKISDMALLWGAFFLVAIIAFTLRKFANVFEASPHGD